MTTQFPVDYDDFVNPLPSDSRNNPSHASQHGNANDAIEAIERYIGRASSVEIDTLTGRIVALESGSGGLDTEQVQDIVGAMIVAGTNITVAYDDATGKLTISATGGSGGLDVEQVQDVVGAMIVAGAGITAVYDDALGKLTISATGGGAGTVTSVGATAPVTSTGGTAPVIGMPRASATVDGYLNAGDFAVFNAKQPAGSYVTNVGVSAPLASTGGTAPTLSMPRASGTVDGYLDNTDFAAFAAKQNAGNYVTTDTVQRITAAKTFVEPVVIESSDTGATATIGIVPDVNSSVGEALEIKSNDGTNIIAPYIVMDTDNLQTTMSGATVGANLSVASVDAFGIVSFGYTSPPPAAFNVQDTNDAVVVIKATNTAPPTAWVDLGLTVTLTGDAPQGSATAFVELILVNPTARNGVFELGMTKNGGAVLTREITTSIPPNFNQTVGFALPLVNAYVNGDVLSLFGRVVSNDNNQFSLSTGSTASDPAMLRINVVGEIGSQLPPTNMVTTDTSQDITGHKTFFSDAFDVKDDTGTKVLEVIQQTGAYGSTAVVINGGNRTNQPALSLQNLGQGVSGMEMGWTGGGTFSIALIGNDFGQSAINKSVLFNHAGTIGTAYNAAFIFKTDQAGAPSVLPANVKSIVKIQHVLDGQMDMLQFSDSTGVSMSWIDKDGVFNGTATVAAAVAWAGVTGKPTTLAGYGITDAYTKTQSDANYPTKSGDGASGIWAINILGNANFASTSSIADYANAVADLNNPANDVKQWIGTQAQYDAIGTKDAATFYNITDATSGGGGGSTAWADITGKPTTVAGYGITDAYTKTESDANYPTKAGAGASGTWAIGISGNAASATTAAACSGNAATATVASGVDDTGAGASLKFWYGTEAQYAAIPTKDSTTVYFRSA